jgi:Tol biopolymer transport system component
VRFHGFQITPDGARVIYLADQRQRDVDELFSVPIDGSQPPVPLNLPLGSDGDISPFFFISPDGSRVVYLGDQERDELYELFSAPVDGSSPPIQLNAPFRLAGERVAPFWFKLDRQGSRVVFGVQLYGQFERCSFFSVGIDGSPPAVPLVENAIAGPEIFFGFQITPDGSRVLYRWDPDRDGVLGLYSSPIARPGGALELSAAPAPLHVETFRISPEGSRVVFRAVSSGSSRRALYTVPLDGSSRPVKLDEGRDIPDFLIAPGGDRVAYHLGRDHHFGFHPGKLRSVPTKGGVPPATLDVGSVEQAILVSPDARRIVFKATRDNPLTIELFSVPLDGSAPPVKLNGPFLPNRGG